MDIVVRALLLEHDIGVALVELAMELGVLLNRLELLDSVDLERVLTGLLKESRGLGLELVDVLIEVFSVETSAFVVSFNHVVVGVCMFTSLFKFFERKDISRIKPFKPNLSRNFIRAKISNLPEPDGG